MSSENMYHSVKYICTSMYILTFYFWYVDYDIIIVDEAIVTHFR